MIKEIFASIGVFLICVLIGCRPPESDEIRTPEWIRGAWRGQNQEIAEGKAKTAGQLRWVFEPRNATITKYGSAVPGSQWISEFECTEIARTDFVYTVRVSFPAFNETPTEIWRWERLNSRSLRYWPLYARNSISIIMIKESGSQRLLAGLKDLAIRFLSADSDELSPPKWIIGIWIGSNYVITDGAISVDGQLRWKFTDKDVVLTKKDSSIPIEFSITDIYCREIENDRKGYSIKVNIPAFFENATEVWRWENSGPDALSYWPLYGKSPLIVPLSAW